MRYERMEEAVFESRPNRFIAHVRRGGETLVCHVKNTGRCRELLVPGTAVYIQKSDNPARKTAYDLISVYKPGTDGRPGQLVNMDSQAPNVIVKELLEQGRLIGGVKLIRPETKYGNSRFDFYAETETDKWFIEVKGVTLEEDGIARFPDAPTERGVRHMQELMACMADGYRAIICFVIQMKGVQVLEANAAMHPAFAETLAAAARAGVEVRAFECLVTADSLTADAEIPVKTEWTYSLDDMTRPLLSWFRSHARVLPWREEVSPYRVWISEIMLQQTRVEAVKPYFDRFTTELPDVKSLAEVPEERLMKLWEGLGYYSRARNLQKAARVVMESCGGQLPDTYEELLKLPGIGSYTAGAVASIACGRPVPAVDGNVLRVWSRLFCREEDILKQSVKTMVEEEITAVIPKDCPGAYNQAWMELGALVCVPNGKAHCEECPLAFGCRAKAEDRINEFPKKTPKKPRRIEDLTVLVIWNGERTLIRKRPKKGLLAGLYELPNVPGARTQEEALALVKEMGLSPIRITPLPDAKHIFTHVEWHMKGFLILTEERDPQAGPEEIWADAASAEEKYSIPSAFHAYSGKIYEK